MPTASRDPVFVKDRHYRLVFVNEAAVEMFGRPREQLLGMTDYDVFPKEQADVFRRHDEFVFETGEEDVNEERVTDAQGNVRTVIAKKRLCSGDSGEKYLVGTLRDVTERARAEEALLESEIKYRTVVENSLAGVYILQGDLFRFVNKRWCEIYGYARKEVVDKMGPTDITHPEERQLVQGHVADLLSGKVDNKRFIHKAVRKDGSTITVNVLGGRMTYRGRPAISGTVYDITEQERAEELLRQKTALLEAQVSASLDGILVVDKGKKILQNQQFNDLFKIPAHIAGSDDDEPRIEWIKGLTRNPEEFYEKVAYMHAHPDETMRDEVELKDGTVLDRYTRPVVGKEGKYYGRIVTFRDITERKRSEMALRASRLQLSEAMDLAHIVYWEFDPAAQRFVFDDPFYAFLGTTAEQEGGYLMTREEYAQRFIHPDDLPLYYQFVAQSSSGPGPESVADMEHRIIRRDGEVRHILARVRTVKAESGRVVKRYGANQDITERKRMESQLRQAQKMEAIGTLAGGIAHDFNNMLAIIIGNAELALDDVEDIEGPKRNLEQIITASKRARNLVKQILTFSRKTEQGKHPLKLPPLIEETCKLLQGTLPSTIRTECELAAGSDTVYADPTQMEQVVMNLATNAAHAMSDGGGVLAIALSNVVVTQDGLKPDEGMSPGRYVKLSVRDTGTGMTREVQRRIFEPFFTTKEARQGTGMGLAVVYGIVKGHNGAITVESEPGRGSVFTVFLPSVEEGE